LSASKTAATCVDLEARLEYYRRKYGENFKAR
jgi:hypothetical protein